MWDNTDGNSRANLVAANTILNTSLPYYLNGDRFSLWGPMPRLLSPSWARPEWELVYP